MCYKNDIHFALGIRLSSVFWAPFKEKILNGARSEFITLKRVALRGLESAKTRRLGSRFEGRKERRASRGWSSVFVAWRVESHFPQKCDDSTIGGWGGWGWREQRRRLREIVTHLFTFGFLSHLRRLPKVPTPLTPDDLTRRCGSDNLLNYFLSRDFIGPASISALLGQVSFSTVKKRHGVFLFLLLFFPFTLSNDSILRRSRCDGNWFMSPF